MNFRNLLLCLCATIGLAGCNSGDTVTSYYIDSISGDDANSGLTEHKAWKSFENLKGIRLNPGDNILLRRGAQFNEVLEISAQGESGRPVVIDAYGEGEKPCIKAPDKSMYAVCVKNSDYVTVQNLEVVNTGSERLAGRTGVKVLCENYGTSHNIVLNALNIHDVNGSLVKSEGGGSGILIENRWDRDSTVSVFDSLIIENCVIRRCERNAMIWSAPWHRRNWHLSTNTIVRRNLIEEVPGDGIVPIGCDGALIEYNLMRNCPALLPDTEAAAGMWPWSCDNTVIQFNEASDHKAPWDAQGFDSDYNCTNTTIQYNYSHDNEGGFLLICNAGDQDIRRGNIGNHGTEVRYNVSIDDAVRQRLTRSGIFSPTIHVAGPTKNTLVENNILHADVKPAAHVDRTIIFADSWGGYADSTAFRNNVFFTPEKSAFNMTRTTNNLFEGNYYLGAFDGKPEDRTGKVSSEVYEKLFSGASDNKEALSFLFEDVVVGDGAATMKAVRKEAIHAFFESLK